MHLVLVLFALFASLFSLQKILLGISEPFFLIGSRMAFAGVALLIFEAIKRPQSFAQLKKMSLLLLMVVLGVSNIYLTNICEILAIDQMPSYKV